MIFLQYGAGNIGRSFIGALFARAGYEVVFVDVNPVVLEALNRDRRYKVEIHDTPPSEFQVEGVRAVDGRDVEAVAKEIATADLMGTAVGPNILPRIFPVIARGLIQRLAQGRPPLDIIIAENLRHASGVLAAGLQENLPPDFPLESYVGLVETSIGKMVPIMPEEIVRQDPTLVYAEAYNTLILDKKGFRNKIPISPAWLPKKIWKPMWTANFSSTIWGTLPELTWGIANLPKSNSSGKLWKMPGCGKKCRERCENRPRRFCAVIPESSPRRAWRSISPTCCAVSPTTLWGTPSSASAGISPANFRGKTASSGLCCWMTPCWWKRL